MDEERLIEITSEIIRNDGPLSRMVYVSSLREEEIHLLCEYINNPKYRGMNVHDGILSFSKDYLESKGISMADVIGEVMDQFKEKQTTLTYLDSMLIGDKSMHQSFGRSNKK